MEPFPEPGGLPAPWFSLYNQKAEDTYGCPLVIVCVQHYRCNYLTLLPLHSPTIGINSRQSSGKYPPSIGFCIVQKNSCYLLPGLQIAHGIQRQICQPIFLPVIRHGYPDSIGRRKLLAIGFQAFGLEIAFGFYLHWNDIPALLKKKTNFVLSGFRGVVVSWCAWVSTRCWCKAFLLAATCPGRFGPAWDIPCFCASLCSKREV